MRPLVAVAAGLALAASLPPWRVWWAGLVGIALVGGLFASATAREALRDGWIAGTTAVLAVGFWIIELVPRFTDLSRGVGVALWLLGGMFMGLWLAVAGGLAAFVAPGRGRALAVAAGLLVAERFGPSIFPMPVAVGLIDAPWIAQSGDLVGVQGLGAVLLGTATAVAIALRQRSRGSVAVAGAGLALVVALTAYGRSRVTVVDAARMDAAVLRVGVVQPDISATLRWQPLMMEPIRMRLGQLSLTLLGGSPELIIWHEGAFPYRLPYRAQQEGEFAPAILPARHGHAAPWPPLLFGALAQGVNGSYYNAAYVRESDGRIDRPVAKRVLVPFGEYVPGARVLPFLGRWFARAEGLRPGERPEMLSVAGRTVGVLDCFEDTIPWAGAEVARADLLVNISNDAWFNGAAPAQHLAASRWRAIESRRDLVRAVNTGYSGHIDAVGRVVTELPPGFPSVAMVFPRVGLRLRPVAPRVIPVAPWLAVAGLAAGYVGRKALDRARMAA